MTVETTRPQPARQIVARNAATGTAGKPLVANAATAKPAASWPDSGGTPKARRAAFPRDTETANRWSELEAVRETMANHDRFAIINGMTPENGGWIYVELEAAAKAFGFLDEANIALVMLCACELSYEAFLSPDAFRRQLAGALRKDARDGGFLGQYAEFASIMIADIAGGVQISRQKLLDFAAEFFRIGVAGGDVQAKTAEKKGGAR